MNEFDGRKIDRKALEEIRIRAVKRVEAGESPEIVIKALGLTRARIYEWIAKLPGRRHRGASTPQGKRPSP